MNNLIPRDFNDLRGLCLEESEMPEERGLKNTGPFDPDHGIQNPISITVSKTVVLVPTASVEASDTNAPQTQDIITSTPWMEELLTSDSATGKVLMANTTVRSGRIHATLFNNESSEMRQAGLRHLEHKQVVIVCTNERRLLRSRWRFLFW